jgi:hypothetical protein
MQAKAMYRLCIIIGISIIAYSCSKKRVEYILKGEFRYTNNLADTVHVKIRNGYFKAMDVYEILPYTALVLNTSGDYHQKKAEPDVYRPAIGGDTTTLYFNDTLCYSEYFYSGNTLHNIGSYAYDRRGDRDYVFYFTIDSALVKRAVKCR